MALRVILLCMLVVGLESCTAPTPKNVTVSLAGKQFLLELVLDDKNRARGMMGRSEIAPIGGMLFIFQDAEERSFWMKNCVIDIDLIFLDSRGTITALHEMTIEPPKETSESDWAYDQRLSHYWSYGPARFAIEIASGSIDELQLRVNDRIDLDFAYLKTLAR